MLRQTVAARTAKSLDAQEIRQHSAAIAMHAEIADDQRSDTDENTMPVKLPINNPTKGKNATDLFSATR